jgi:hypothetical protein
MTVEMIRQKEDFCLFLYMGEYFVLCCATALQQYSIITAQDLHSSIGQSEPWWFFYIVDPRPQAD